MPQEDAVAKAKTELGKANKLSSEADPAGRFKPKPAPMPAAPEKPAMSPKVGTGLGAELGAKARNVAEYNNAVPKYHKGGVVKETGPALLEKGETVRTKEQEKSVEDKAGMAEKPAKKEKKASPEALMTSEDKAPKKEAASGAKSESKSSKKGGYTETHIQHHSHGGHTVKHKHKDNPDKDVAYSAQDLEGVKAGLDQHIGGGAGQAMAQEPEPMPNAEQAQAAAPMAGAPPAGAMPQQV